MKRAALAIVLAILSVSTASAINCPPNALHCDLFIEIGDEGMYALVEMGANGSSSNATVTTLEPGDSAELFVNVTLAANATVETANLTVTFDDSGENVTFTANKSAHVAANATSQLLTFPITVPEDAEPGTTLFIPVLVENLEAGAEATAFIPLQIAGSPARPTPPTLTPVGPDGDATRGGGESTPTSEPTTERTPLGGPIALVGVALAALLARRRGP